MLWYQFLFGPILFGFSVFAFLFSLLFLSFTCWLLSFSSKLENHVMNLDLHFLTTVVWDSLDAMILYFWWFSLLFFILHCMKDLFGEFSLFQFFSPFFYGEKFVPKIGRLRVILVIHYWSWLNKPWIVLGCITYELKIHIVVWFVLYHSWFLMRISFTCSD